MRAATAYALVAWAVTGAVLVKLQIDWPALLAYFGFVAGGGGW